MLVMLRAAARICLALRHPGWHLPRTMKEHAVKQRQPRHCPASLTSDIKAFLLIVQPRVAAFIHCAPQHLGWPLPHNMKECAVKKTATLLQDSLVLDSLKSEIKVFLFVAEFGSITEVCIF